MPESAFLYTASMILFTAFEYIKTAAITQTASDTSRHQAIEYIAGAPKGDQYKAWLIDYGAVANPQVQSGGSTVAGTFGYMPSEQLTGNPIPASVIYSLAAVIVYVLSGRSPRGGNVHPPTSKSAPYHSLWCA